MNHSHDTVAATRPDERKLGLLGTLFLWVAATLVTPTVMTGQMFIPDTSPVTAFEVVVLGSLLGCLALGAIAAIGTKTGLPTFVFARQVFGTSGAKVFALLNLVILMGWGIIQFFCFAVE
jgi:NCS1 family nucleobase:cation symporter-1